MTLATGREVCTVTPAYVRDSPDDPAPFETPKRPDDLLGPIDARGRGTPTIDLRVTFDDTAPL